jgi:hypothetical protein
VKPSLGFTKGANHGYLGHFCKEKYLRDGHNTTPKRSIVMPAPGRRVQASSATHATLRSGVAKTIDALSRRTAKRAIRAGDPNVAAERPVLAAKVARRAAIKSARATGDRAQVLAAKQGGRQMIRAARKDPNSSRSERKARRVTVPRTPSGRPTY